MTGLRPGPALTEPAADIHDGLILLARRWATWQWPTTLPQPAAPAGESEEKPPAPPTGYRAVWALWRLRAGRAAGVLGGGYLAITAAVGTLNSAPWMAAPAGVLLAVAARRAAVDARPPAPAVDDDQVLAAVHALFGDADRIHLSPLARALGERLPGEWTTATVREWAGRSGVVVTESVRVKGVGVNTGIYRRDLPPPPPLSDPLSGRSPAGQGATATPTDLEIEEWAPGAFTARNPAETTARHHTI
ncbi:hypothetical protein FH609_011790 [Streptomyces sp. 3MP-14]|uniref:Uncharacterized protein n=1 Tax=Streptomyces mimosae TaxID=2586635 RepID=A0A5N6AGE3_9ACTN|nr:MULTISPECIES: hypothetical protein [Streptomyces]KAB8167076.1 hypothetical protein FH607_009240 [Streptomyces mimosae]KAB8177017.1 hypothetical protein FH609_011790 [Streptomyces sp. 3MP-14]